MASIQKIETKAGTRWRLRVYMGRSPDGTRRYTTRTFDRKKDADTEANRLEHQKDRGVLVTPSKEPLAKYLRRWLDDVMEGRVRAVHSPTTRGCFGATSRSLRTACRPSGANDWIGSPRAPSSLSMATCVARRVFRRGRSAHSTRYCAKASRTRRSTAR